MLGVGLILTSLYLENGTWHTKSVGILHERNKEKISKTEESLLGTLKPLVSVVAAIFDFQSDPMNIPPSLISID